MRFDAQILQLGEALRAEGVAIGTSELNDAFAALSEVPRRREAVDPRAYDEELRRTHQ